MEVIKYKIYDYVYEAIKNGFKTVEIRLYNEKSSKIKKGNLIEFSVIDDKNKKLVVKVTNIYYFNNIDELWHIKDKILPDNLKIKDDLRNTLYAIFGEEKVNASKFVGIEFKLPKNN